LIGRGWPRACPDKRNQTRPDSKAGQTSKNQTSDMVTTQQKEAKKDWKRLLNYQWIVKNIPYFLFLSVLAVIYIYNGHYSDNTVKDINRTSRELKELQYEYKSLKSEVMFRSKQSELAKAVEPLGLKELVQPPLVLKDSTGK
jgi:Bacteriodetes cell division protein (FtsL-like)